MNAQEKTLEEAHVTIKKLEASIERANRVLAERRAPQKKMSEGLKTIWFVLTFTVVFNLILFGIVGIHIHKDIENFYMVDASIKSIKEEIKSYKDWVLKVHPDFDRGNQP